MTRAPSQFLQEMAPHGAALHAAARSVLDRQDAKKAALTQLLKELPQIRPSAVALDQDWVTIGRAHDLSVDQQAQLRGVLTQLKPWRKGPFDLFGIRIESEWHSAFKWNRVAPHLAPLTDRKVLDVGSSNGYYQFRMAPAKPRVVLGIEPYLAYYFQYLALQQLLGLPHIHNLPLTLEALPAMPGWFDTIFCMGILYHRRSPLETLALLKNLLTPGGQLILETLILQGDTETALCPRHRYACMRNVHFIPTVPCLENWLFSCGYDHIRCVDVTPTTLGEQRKTDWIDSDSLDDFLDPIDKGLTKEGYPAPVRAVVIAHS
jgi:tRNA (mo5U34)-methyltransferase